MNVLAKSLTLAKILANVMGLMQPPRCCWGFNLCEHQIIHRRPALLVSKIETTVAAKFQQLQDLFPGANVVSMVESDATVLLYDYTSIGVKVRGG